MPPRRRRLRGCIEHNWLYPSGGAVVTSDRMKVLSRGIVAGGAGGLIEVAWVTLYAAATGGDPTILARGVTTAAGVTALLPAAPIALGVAIHMTLAVLLGVALSAAWSALRDYRPDLRNPLPFMLAALAGIWATNFFAVLPIV